MFEAHPIGPVRNRCGGINRKIVMRFSVHRLEAQR